MKKPIKLATFNLGVIIAAILCFSERGLGLGFDPSDGAMKFALSLSLTFLGLAIFFIGNFWILVKVEKAELKIGKLTTIEQCISALNSCKKTDPAFLGEIRRAIEQLYTLQRRKDSLTTLLEVNGVSEAFNYLNQTADTANYCVFTNVKSIINRLIVFDNEEYSQNQNSYDIDSHRTYIRGLLDENQEVLDEYAEMLEAVSKIGDRQINLDNIKDMTAALRKVVKGKDFGKNEVSNNETMNQQ